jgi:hypothetical protein
VAQDGTKKAVAEPIDTHLFFNGVSPDEVHLKLLTVAARTCYFHAVRKTPSEPNFRIVHNGRPVARELTGKKPPRWRNRGGPVCGGQLHKNRPALLTAESKRPLMRAAVVQLFIVNEEKRSVLGRPGSDLLFQVLRLSTIGAGEFYGRVRDGIGYRPPAKTTRPAKDV